MPFKSIGDSQQLRTAQKPTGSYYSYQTGNMVFVLQDMPNLSTLLCSELVILMGGNWDLSQQDLPSSN